MKWPSVTSQQRQGISCSSSWREIQTWSRVDVDTVSCLMIVCCSLLTSRFLFGSKGPGAAGKPDPHPARPVWTRNAAHPRTFSVVVVLWAVWKILLRSQLFLDLIIISVSKINQSTFIYVYLCLFMLHLSNKSKCFWKIRNRISRKQNKWFKKENKNNIN